MVVKVRDHAQVIGCQTIQLTTYKTMYAAMRLYHRLGFRIIEEVKPGAPILIFNETVCLRVKHVLPMIGEKEYNMLLTI